jgi:hypothetical protein
VLEAVNETLGADAGRFGGLSAKEREILEKARIEFGKQEAGWDLLNGKYRFATQSKGGTRFSGDVGVGLDVNGSGAYYLDEGEKYAGTDSWATFYTNGDIGEHFSYNFSIAGGIMRAQQELLGETNTYYVGFSDTPDGENVNRDLPVYTWPLAYFPYSYEKGWDGFIFGPGNITADGMEKWPQKIAIGPRLLSEMSGTLFGDMLYLSFGRIRREWGAMAPGSSLVFNSAARPFIALEAVFSPAYWFSFSALTGVLEYFKTVDNSYASAWSSQNAFSIEQLEINVKNYFHFDIGSTVVWPKRFELGYIFPINNNFMYQNNIGDFDNMGLFFNIKGQYPGIASLWFSFFADEIEVDSVKKMFELDRHMFALQAGTKIAIPWLPFASLTASYTKIEPYTYTHTRNFVPWYGDSMDGVARIPMESSYTNNGVGLGYYLPPNSDEVKIRLDALPSVQTAVHLQYQMIRHGAEFGPHQVDGSSYLSELDPGGRGSKKVLEKDFLNDGAYQWTHIVKAGAEYSFAKLPLTVYGETGFVYSDFKDISDDEYAEQTGITVTPSAFEYPELKGVIFTIGFRLFL